MKRHQSLYPLSRDHHHALVQVRNLRIAAAGRDPENLKQAAEHFVSFWESDLRRHFLQEELFVLPLLAKHHSPDSDEVRGTLNQHAEIRRLIDELSDKLARGEMIKADLLNTLGNSLRRHIRFEESELFPAVEVSIPEEELWRINEQLVQDHYQVGTGVCALSPKKEAKEERP